MGLRKTAKIIALLMLTCVLAACAKPSLTIDTLDEASGIKATAENAGSDLVATSTGAITIADGDVIIISPCMDKGGFHLTITASDGVTTVFDDDVDGRIMFQTDAAPDTYDVTVSGNKATGWMTVFAAPADEIAGQDASLGEALEDAGIDPSILSPEE